MKEYPLPFSPLMARAWYENRKTQTRRIMVPQPESVGILMHEPAGDLSYVWPSEQAPGEYVDRFCRCPYGGPGDRVWVRETLVPSAAGWVSYECDGALADEGRPVVWPWKVRKIIPRYMPRWACRSYGEILAVRVERVRDISSDDARAEGVDDPDLVPRTKFADLWDSINADRGYGWAVNPFVWVLTFRRLE